MKELSDKMRSEEKSKFNLRLLCAVFGGITALFVGLETLFTAVGLLGLSAPENAIGAVNTHIFGNLGYKLALVCLSLLVAVVFYLAVGEERKTIPFRYAVTALIVRSIAVVFAIVALWTLARLGLDGGVSSLASPDGYLTKMVDPIIKVLSTATVLVSSVVYLCGYFATVKGLLCNENTEKEI